MAELPEEEATSDTGQGACWKLMMGSVFSIMPSSQGPWGIRVPQSQSESPSRKPTAGWHPVLPPSSSDLLSLRIHAPARPLPLALRGLVVPTSQAAGDVRVAEVGRCKPLHFALCGAWGNPCSKEKSVSQSLSLSSRAALCPLGARTCLPAPTWLEQPLGDRGNSKTQMLSPWQRRTRVLSAYYSHRNLPESTS